MQHPTEPLRAPSQAERVRRDTGLTPIEQDLRASAARHWALRIRHLQFLSGCSATDALRAIEAADRSAAR